MAEKLQNINAMLWKGDVCLKYRIVSVIPSLLETGCQLKSHDSAYRRVTLCSCVSIGWRESEKKGNKIKQMSFCLLSRGLRLRLNDSDDIHSIVNKWLCGPASKQKETGRINHRNEKPVLPDKLHGSTRRGMKCDGAHRAADAAAGPTCHSLSVRRACSSGQSFRASLIQRLLASCFWLRSLLMEMPGQTEVGRNSEDE